MHSAAQAREGQRGGGGNRKMGSGQLEGGKEGDGEVGGGDGAEGGAGGSEQRGEGSRPQ